MLRKQQRQAPKIRVSSFTVPLGLIPLLLRAHVVDHVPQMVVRLFIVGVRVDEVVLGQFEDDGDEDEEFA
jgi:hypothetical protein